MEGNLRAELARDFVLMNRNIIGGDQQKIYEAKTSPQPQRAHCPIEARTICESEGMWWPVRCTQEYADMADSWSRLPALEESSSHSSDGEHAPEIRYGHCQIKGGFFTYDKAEFNQNGHSPFAEQSDSKKAARRKRSTRSATRGRVGRNARERRRVKAVSSAFLKLRKVVPQTTPNAAPARRLSKLKTLKGAIHYIKELQNLLDIVSYHPFTNFNALYSTINYEL